jgi:hypothetical protein
VRVSLVYFWGRKAIIAAAVFVICVASASATFYIVSEGDTGWTTGIRQTLNESFDLSGAAVGDGTYQRYTDVNFIDVRMRERISAKQGALDTAERIRTHSEDVNSVVVLLTKAAGTQNYDLTVNETWPAAMNTARTIDYQGRGISDREIFGNNQDYVGSSYVYTTDLKKSRACYMDLRNAWFELLMNDTTKSRLVDLYQPAKRTFYSLSSRSTGIATLKYRQNNNRVPVNEGYERYEGTFGIDRKISMTSSGRARVLIEDDWLPCCTGVPDIWSAPYIEEKIFGE